MRDDLGGPIARRWRAVRRGARFHARTLSKSMVRIHVDIRWRLGDEIMALPIYEAIKQTWPRCELTVTCTYPELLDGNPFVDAVFAKFDGDMLRNCDRFINLRDASRTVQRQTHYARLASVPIPKSRPRVYWQDDEPPVALQRLADPRIAICTGASWATKRWPISNWSELCRALTADGFTPVQVGRGDESIGLDHNLFDKTSVREAGAVLKHCALFIGCDSGLLHLAAAVGTPAIGLFGPTDPAILFDPHDCIAILRNDRPCEGCWNGPLTMREPGICPRDVQSCLEPITVDAVNAAVQRMFGDAVPDERCA